MIRQEIIRDVNYNIIETIDNDIHIKYNTNSDIIYYKSNNFIFPSQLLNCDSPQEQEFINIVKDSTIKIDEVEYPNYIFLFKRKKSLFEYNLKSGNIWVNYRLIWSIFETKYSMNDEQIRVFLKDMMEKHFNCKDITTFKW